MLGNVNPIVQFCSDETKIFVDKIFELFALMLRLFVFKLCSPCSKRQIVPLP